MEKLFRYCSIFVFFLRDGALKNPYDYMKIGDMMQNDWDGTIARHSNMATTGI